MIRVISAGPSPYARKVRIALFEKGIPFELLTEVPWDSTTQTKLYNPLEKLPILLSPDADPVYESHHILEHLELKYPHTRSLFPEDVDARLFAKKVEVVADGICDAAVLRLFDLKREKPSKEWIARQMRKIEGGVKALNVWVTNESTGKEKEYIVGGEFGLADVAAGAVCGYIVLRFEEFELEKKYPNLGRYWRKLEARESFKNSVPKPQTFSDKVV